MGVDLKIQGIWAFADGDSAHLKVTAPKNRLKRLLVCTKNTIQESKHMHYVVKMAPFLWGKGMQFYNKYMPSSH